MKRARIILDVELKNDIDHAIKNGLENYPNNLAASFIAKTIADESGKDVNIINVNVNFADSEE